MSPRRFAIPTLALVIGLTSCGPPPTPSASATPSAQSLRPVTLLLGFRPDVQFAPFYLAQQEGYFADAGLDVTIEHSTDVLRLVADGQAEFGVADATDVMIGRTSGIPVKYVSTLYDRFPVALIGSPALVPAVPSELAGLRIGTPGRFGSSWHALLALLDAGGLTADDVTIREYPQFNQVEGLLNGDVDVITGFRSNEPLQLSARGTEVELLTVDDFAPLPGPGIVVGDELLTGDRDLVSAFVHAIARAQSAVIADPEAGLAAAEDAVPTIGEDRETAMAVLRATLELWGSEGGFSQGAINVPIWESAYDTMRRLGFIDGSTPMSDMVEQGIVSAP
ncbi:MAG TPA: ABC transporter substrate-binding protein [Candidatus Dormibacteraeota bacterium]|nr:ABC transporter substrate-binding protein [Candidatus Dormibacteraeota bacterium]